MSADFYAGWISGAVGVLIGNPLDLIKVRVQAGQSGSASTGSPAYFSNASSLIRGAAAPALGYGALNALLFVTKNHTAALLTGEGQQSTLWTEWVAGAIGGLATWVVSTPQDVIKCRAQLASSSTAQSGGNSWEIAKGVLKKEGIKGLYCGGTVTALRDSFGYGWYFWSYELSTRMLGSWMRERGMTSGSQDVAKTLLCGGLGGVISWASVFPLDVIKTRVQTQILGLGENAALLGTESRAEGSTQQKRMGAIKIARTAYRTEGAGVFFRGLGICSARAFVVNAVQWAVYEWIRGELEPGWKNRHRPKADLD